MQALYDYTSSAATAHLPGDKSTAATASGVLTELHVESFDAEQIWLQLDMPSAQLVRRAKRLLKKAAYGHVAYVTSYMLCVVYVTYTLEGYVLHSFALFQACT